MMETPPIALTIAGSDSGGSAGIQADLKTFTCLEVFGTSVITSVTSQNTLTVDGIHPIPADFVSQQIKAVLSDIGADAIKIGLLCDPDIVKSVASTLREFYPENQPIKHLVVDPIMISGSGAQLLAPAAVKTLVSEILPLSYVLTPNVPEAERILEAAQEMKHPAVAKEFLTRITTLEEMKVAAKALASLGPALVLLKGGHLPFYKNTGKAVPAVVVENKTVEANEPMELVDLLYTSATGEFKLFRQKFMRTDSTHGTGCTLSAAIAAFLASGLEPVDAVGKSINYVHAAIRTTFSIGKGKGPLNHMHRITERVIEPKSNFNPHPMTNHLLQVCATEWKDFTEHPFVQGIGNGTLPNECFIHYIIQDYFFLENYARAFAIGSYKSKLLAESAEFANAILGVADEIKMHLKFCASFGIDFHQIQATPESMANVAYTRYVLDVGATGDILDLRLAMAPCLIGYGHIATRLINNPNTVKGSANPYWEWIQNYADEAFQGHVTKGINEIEKLSLLIRPSPTRLGQLEKIFRTATRLETAFWDMGMNRS